MILDRFMGFWVTDQPEVLAAFIKQAQEHYNAIEAALSPIKEAITDLERDWGSRKEAFWQQAITNLRPLRQASKACSALFEQEHSSQAEPVPMIIAATVLTYQFGLGRIESKIEEAGILLTAHRINAGSLEEEHIRQRQRVLEALRKLEKAGREVVAEGRARLDDAAKEQHCITRPARKQEAKPATEGGRLRVVGKGKDEQ
jgi:hypothetical protein